MIQRNSHPYLSIEKLSNFLQIIYRVDFCFASRKADNPTCIIHCAGSLVTVAVPTVTRSLNYAKKKATEVGRTFRRFYFPSALLSWHKTHSLWWISIVLEGVMRISSSSRADLMPDHLKFHAGSWPVTENEPCENLIFPNDTKPAEVLTRFWCGYQEN